MCKSFIADLENELKSCVKGEVRFSEIDRSLYSTDASNFQIYPLGVVIPKTIEDVINTVSTVNEYDVPIIARGGGSGLAGQSIGKGVILDFSKYLNKIKYLDEESKTVIAQPGITLDLLNKYLNQYDLTFGPDPSSAEVATIGGVISNNATGAHSILYGMAGDHIVSSDVVLSNGNVVQLSKENYINSINKNGSEVSIFHKLSEFISDNKQLISDRFSKHWRRASGYSLNYFLKEQFNPAQILASSEGTLAISTEYKLRVVEKQRLTGLCVIQLEELVSAIDMIPDILSKEPSAIELIDGYLIDLTRKQSRYSKLLSFVKGSPSAILIVELFGKDLKDVERRSKDLLNYINSKRVKCEVSLVLEKEQQEKIWNVRKAGLGLLMSRRGSIKPIPCIEDVSIPVHQLSNYVRDIVDILKRLKLEAAFYGHASAGCLHIRPLIDLETSKGESQMQELMDAALNLSLKYGGVLSGEHGDGIQRSSLNKALFGEEIYNIMKELKYIFDPENRLNPNKVVDGFSTGQYLRYKKADQDGHFNTVLDWTKENGVISAVKMCNGQGVCRKLGEGVMCPSFKATGDEKDSTRARANILRAFLNNEIDKEQFYKDDFYKVFELCIGCKACKSECPSSVDVSKMKTEYLAQYKKKSGFTIRDRIFSNIDQISSLLSKTPRLTNLITTNVAFKKVLSQIGVSEQRAFPKIGEKRFSKYLSGTKSKINNHNKVVYFNDTWTEYYYPEIGIATVKLLNRAGFEVLLIDQRVCCGRPMISNGQILKARVNALKNISMLSEYTDQGISVVFSEPSCLSTFIDDYFDIVPNSSKLDRLKGNLYLIDEFLNINKERFGPLISNERGGKVFIHGHCHQRALSGLEDSMELLDYFGFEVEQSGAGCCGMAGSFGYEKEHYYISKLIGEDRLFPKIRELQENTKVCISGISCMEQINHFTNKRAAHICNIISERLKK